MFPCVIPLPFSFFWDALLSNISLFRLPALEVIDTFGTRTVISYPSILIFLGGLPSHAYNLRLQVDTTQCVR